jgi:hypothetical protein
MNSKNLGQNLECTPVSYSISGSSFSAIPAATIASYMFTKFSFVTHVFLLLSLIIFIRYSVSAIKSFASSMIVIFVRGFPIFPKRIQSWHMVGSMSWAGDSWLALKAYMFPCLTQLLIVSNDMLTLDKPDFLDSSSIIFLDFHLEAQ